MDRMTTLVDGAILLANLGATFEQHVQNLVTDYNVTIGSHRNGDHLQGDYANQSVMDDEINSFHVKSSFLHRLQYEGMVDEELYLVDSPMKLTDLSNPNKPRRFCIVESPRPDGNSDRNPFTLIEGALLLPLSDINFIAKSIFRAEVRGKYGIEERMAVRGVEEGRLLHLLSMRHYIEHWGDAGHNATMELLSVVDKARLIQGTYNPIDELRTDETSWFEAPIDEEAAALYGLVEKIARSFKDAQMPIQNGDVPYEGTPLPSNVTLQRTSQLAGPSVKVELGRYDAKGKIIINTPNHKNRRGIDSLISTNRGLKRLSEIDGSIVEYERKMSTYKGNYKVVITIPRDELGAVQSVIEKVENVWHQPGTASPIPMTRPQMPREIMTNQIMQARQMVIDRGYRSKAII